MDITSISLISGSVLFHAFALKLIGSIFSFRSGNIARKNMMPTSLATEASCFLQTYEADLSVDPERVVREWMHLKEAGNGSKGLKFASTSDLDSSHSCHTVVISNTEPLSGFCLGHRLFIS